MSRIASQDEAHDYLSTYFEDIAAIIRAGWRGWTSLPSEAVVNFNATTRANIVHNGMTVECRARFGGRAGITVSEKRRFIEVNFHNKIILRFKKLTGGKLRTSGVDTRQRREFMFQQLSLPGMPNPTVVIAGYRLDALEQEIEAIFLTCPLGFRHNAWTIKIDDGVATAATVAALTLPSGPFKTVQVRSALVKDEPEEGEEKEA